MNNILSIKQEKQVRHLVNNTVNFLSGTMPPAKSNPDTNDIEDFGHAMEHYAKRGVKKVMLQPKFMGSRAQLYIFNDINKCYAISRKGYTINRIDLSKVFKDRHDFWFKNVTDNKIHLVIEDGELMPWTALGESLIDEKFSRYSKLYNREIQGLKHLNFEEVISKTISKFSSDDRRSKDMNNFLSLDPLYNQIKKLNKFDYQLNLYSKKSDIEYKPFNILKIVYTDGIETIRMDNNFDNFLLISKDPYIIVNTNEWKYDNNLKQYFHENIYFEELEGVVVKPLVYEYSSDRKICCAPYIKVRNKEYLRLVYGPDYDNSVKLLKLIKKKSIGKKVGLSIKEHEIGRKLLQIPINMLNKNNSHYKDCIIEALLSIEKENQLDPRL